MNLPALVRRLLFLLALCFCSVAFMHAQTKTGSGDEFDFSDIPVETGSLPYIGVGGGYDLLLSFPNFANLNQIATTFGMDPFSGQMYMHGGGGWAAIGIIPNVRLGVYGQGGSKSSSKELTIGGVGVTRTLRYSQGLTAAQVDYAIPVFSRFTIAPAIMIGGATQTVKLTQSVTAGVPYGTGIFDSAAVTGSTTGPNSYSTAEKNSLFLMPSITFDYALTQFILVRAGAAYSMYGPFNSGGDWKDTEGTTITNMPNVKGDAFTLQLGLFVGLFQQ